LEGGQPAAAAIGPANDHDLFVRRPYPHQQVWNVGNVKTWEGEDLVNVKTWNVRIGLVLN